MDDRITAPRPSPGPAHPAANSVFSRWGGWGWLVVVLLIVVQYLMFREFVRRELLWAYPVNYDQTAYLLSTYQTYDDVRTEGLVRGLWNGFHNSTPTGVLMHVEATVLFLLLGPGRLSALTVNFLHFALLQLALVETMRWLTRRWSVALLGVGLLLTATTSYMLSGGDADFRLDFGATCLFGLMLCAVIRSSVFASRRWSLVVGAAAVTLILFRHLTAAYVAVMAGLLLPYLVLRWWRRRGDPDARRLESRRLAGFGLAAAVLLLTAAPVIWMRREVLWGYYGQHVTGPYAAALAAQSGRDPLYYVTSILCNHAAGRFANLAAVVLLAAAALTGGRPGAARRSPWLFWLGAAALAGLATLTVLGAGTDWGEQSCPVPIGAVAAAAAGAVGLLRRVLAPRADGPTRPHGAPAGAFLAAALFVPLGILTLDPDRSSIAGGIVVPCLVWVVLAALIGLLGLHREGARRPAVEGVLAVLAGAALFTGGVQVERCRRVRPMTGRRADVEQAMALDDLLYRHAASRGWESPGVAFTTVSCDYLYPSTLQAVMCERHGGRPRFRCNLCDTLPVPEDIALAQAGASDFLLLARPGLLAWPFDVSMQAAMPRLQALADSRFIKLGTFHINKDEVTVYARPAPEGAAAPGAGAQ